MDNIYSPQDIESKWYKIWENHNHFNPQGNQSPYCIMLPPPNITGSLHMGHGFQHTLMDILIRYHRMRGDCTLWQPGTDHAGISTQLVVERQLEAQGLIRKQMTRAEFLQYVWEWKNTAGMQITQQMRRIGSSTDWTRERFTMDEPLSAAVQKVFIQLYNEQLIYRGTRLVNWDPKLSTAISDLEVITTEEDGYLWYINYPLVGDQTTYITIATTRPETLFGDAAVAVHPEDERYKHLIGKQLALPLCDRTIPMIADDYVNPQFGTGCVKITPAHDFNDHAVSKRHNLDMITIMTKKATINKNAPIQYQGMDRFIARKNILQDLTTLGLLIKTEPYKIKIPRGEKSNVIIEPLLTEQWYVKIHSLAQPAIAAVKNKEIRFIPETWQNTYLQWMENITDWCISRQLWWGHRIPAWYDNQGNTYVGHNETEIRHKYKLADTIILKQDEDVLDTWFSSALWPFATLGWPEQTADFSKFYPTTTLITGFDIIFFWVARMIMFGLKFTGKIPFKDVVITGLIRDSEGQKMSKSKGNVLDPIDIIDGIDLETLINKRTANLLLTSATNDIIQATKTEFPDGIPAYGTDALRFTFCALAATGRNVRFSLDRVAGYRNFCNKLWNAARYVLINADAENIDFGDGALQYNPTDLWILSKLQRTILTAENYLATYRFDLLANTLYDFVWHEYCDWYLECSKSILYSENILPAAKRGTQNTLINVLEQILKLLHPIMPFITEEIWQRTSQITGQDSDSIMLSQFPIVMHEYMQPNLEEEMLLIQHITQAIRTIRSDMLISPGTTILLLIKCKSTFDQDLIEKYSVILIKLNKINQITFIESHENPPKSATAIINNFELFIPLIGLINIDAEMLRLEKEIAKLDKNITLAENKLNNNTFIQKAPIDIIDKEKDKLQQNISAREKLMVQKNTL